MNHTKGGPEGSGPHAPHSSTLRMNAAENIDYIKKSFQQKLLRIKFSTKNLVDAYYYLPQE